MRERHFPRLCRRCVAPMARQEDTCWRCGIEWAPTAAPPTTLRLVPALGQAELAPTVAVGCVPLELERRTNEGGSFAPAVAAALRVIEPR
jgi:hypothetical protein